MNEPGNWLKTERRKGSWARENPEDDMVNEKSAVLRPVLGVGNDNRMGRITVAEWDPGNMEPDKEDVHKTEKRRRRCRAV